MGVTVSDDDLDLSPEEYSDDEDYNPGLLDPGILTYHGMILIGERTSPSGENQHTHMGAQGCMHGDVYTGCLHMDVGTGMYAHGMIPNEGTQGRLPIEGADVPVKVSADKETNLDELKAKITEIEKIELVSKAKDGKETSLPPDELKDNISKIEKIKLVSEAKADKETGLDRLKAKVSEIERIKLVSGAKDVAEAMEEAVEKLADKIEDRPPDARHEAETKNVKDLDRLNDGSSEDKNGLLEMDGTAEVSRREVELSEMLTSCSVGRPGVGTTSTEDSDAASTMH